MHEYFSVANEEKKFKDIKVNIFDLIYLISFFFILIHAKPHTKELELLITKD